MLNFMKSIKKRERTDLPLILILLDADASAEHVLRLRAASRAAGARTYTLPPAHTLSMRPSVMIDYFLKCSFRLE